MRFPRKRRSDANQVLSRVQASAPYADSVVESIVNAYYPRELAAVDAARVRAQSAYSVSSALVALLIGAGLLASFDERSSVIQVLGAVALALWLLAACLYLRAVASPIAPYDRGLASEDSAFVDTVLSRASAERLEVDRRLGVANTSSMIALLVTISTVLLAIFWNPVATSNGIIVLTDNGISMIARVCPRRPTTLAGDIDDASISTDILHIKVLAGICDGGPIDLEVAINLVSAIRVNA
jgi:hypothetical protein